MKKRSIITLILVVATLLSSLVRVSAQATPSTPNGSIIAVPSATTGQPVLVLKTPKEAAAATLDLIKITQADTDFVGPGQHPGLVADLATLQDAANNVIQDDGKDAAATASLVSKFLTAINTNISRVKGIANRDTETPVSKAKCRALQMQLTAIRLSFHPDAPAKTSSTSAPNPNSKMVMPKAISPANPADTSSSAPLDASTNNSDTTTSRLETTQKALKKALASINKAATANHGGFIEQTRADTTLAVADVAAALTYVKDHPEIDTLTPGMVPADRPKFTLVSIPSYDIGADGKGKSPYADATVDSLDAALRPLFDEPKGDKPVLRLGDIGGNRDKLIADIKQALADLIAAFDFAHNRATTSAPAPATSSTPLQMVGVVGFEPTASTSRT